MKSFTNYCPLNTPLGQQVVALLGEKIIKNGKIDRNVIAKIVFNDPALLKSLEKLIHPAVQDEIDKQYQQANKQGAAPLFVAEIPLLFEGSGSSYFDDTISVWADPETCKKRFHKATGLGNDEYDRRMANQLNPDEKVLRANHVINNTGDLELTKKQVQALFKMLTT